MTDSNIQYENLLTEVFVKATMVYSKILECKCIDFNATKSYEEIETERAIDNDSAVSITLQKAGILKEGTLLRHTQALGKRRALKKKLMPDDIVTGQENLIEDTYGIVVMGGEKYKHLPPKYKQTGMVYIYDDGMAICAGDDFIYYLSKPFLGRVYTEGICIKGKPFKSPILAVLVPLCKRKEKEDNKEDNTELDKEEIDMKDDDMILEIVNDSEVGDGEIVTDETDYILGGNLTPAQKAVNWAIKIAKDDSFSYGIKPYASRLGCYFCTPNTLQMKKFNAAKKAGSKYGKEAYKDKWKKTYVCLTFVGAAYAHGAGDPEILKACKSGRLTCYSNNGNFTNFKCWKKIGKCKNLTVKDLEPGDVIIDWSDTNSGDGHACMYVGGDKLVEAIGKGFDKESIAVRTGAANRLKKYGKDERNYVMRYKGQKEEKKKSVTEIAKEVIAGKWGAGKTRKKKLEAAGYDYDKVQKKVNELIAAEKKKEEKKKEEKKTTTEIAKEVIAGKWGNGKARKEKLEKAGYNYNKVQKKVNELIEEEKKKEKTVIIGAAKKVVKTPEELALEVIAGKWGVGETRKKKLEGHGYNYDEVQRAVNDVLTMTWDKWEKSLQDTANDLKARGVQYRGDGSKAGKIDKYTDCSGYIQEALYNIHMFPKNEQFYLSKDLQGTKKGVECIEALFKVVHPKNKWKKAALKPGDIVGFNWGDGVHTMVYAGKKGKKDNEYPVWYSFGGSTPFSDKPVRKPFYEDKTVYVKLRPYNLNKQYRDK